MVQAEQVLGRFWPLEMVCRITIRPLVHILDVFSTYLVYLAELYVILNVIYPPKFDHLAMTS